ncbi:MAG TPA: hypothetical protein VH637_00910 [Streptosporangiaceae bacterium]|jgi:acyl carrier protein
MDAQPAAAGLGPGGVLASLAAMLAAVTGEDGQWAAGITAASELEADLHIDSLELAALGGRLARASGGRVCLDDLLASLDIDRLIGLTAGDIAAWVSERLAPRDLAGTSR